MFNFLLYFEIQTKFLGYYLGTTSEFIVDPTLAANPMSPKMYHRFFLGSNLLLLLLASGGLHLELGKGLASWFTSLVWRHLDLYK